MLVRDSFNGMVAAAAISAAFELGMLDELRQSASLSVRKFAEVHDLDHLSLNGLCGVLEHAQILHLRGDTITPGPEFPDAWLNKGYFLWLVRGYGDVLRRTAELCHVSAGSTARRIRDGGWIASAGKDYGEHFVDPVLSAVLSGAGFTNAADLGCGRAGRLIEMARHHPGGHFVGVEVNPGAAAAARNAVQQAGLADRIEIVNADIAELKGRPVSRNRPHAVVLPRSRPVAGGGLRTYVPPTARSLSGRPHVPVQRHLPVAPPRPV